MRVYGIFEVHYGYEDDDSGIVIREPLVEWPVPGRKEKGCRSFDTDEEAVLWAKMAAARLDAVHAKQLLQ